MSDDSFDNPFDDPELRAFMRANRIVHAPGMAAKTLADMAPLLADDGIDLDNLHEDDLDRFNEALARAAERYNLELFTPVGRERTLALDVLRQVALALARDDAPAARAALATVHPEPTDVTPAASHVIGAGVGLLDTWHTHPVLREWMRGPLLAPWGTPGRLAARFVLVYARAGAAFDNLAYLVVRHTGIPLTEGTALAVAACVAATAAARGTDVADAADLLFGDLRHLPSGPAPAPASRPGKRAPKAGRHVSGNPAKRDQAHADRMLVRDFAAWLADQDLIAAPTVQAEIGVFETVLTTAMPGQNSLAVPDGLVEMLDQVFAMGEDDDIDMTESLLAMLGDYADFRMGTAPDPSVWTEASVAVERALQDGQPVMGILKRISADDAEIDPEERRAALLATRPAAAVPRLLEWLGEGRKITSTGGVRRADITEVAAMIGVEAVGVSKRPPYSPGALEPTALAALSMWDVVPLAAWWEALVDTEVIRTGTTVVHPGPAAKAWRDGAPPVALADELVGLYVINVLTHAPGSPAFLDYDILRLTLVRLLEILEPEVQFEDAPEEGAFLRSVLAARSSHNLENLVEMGLLVRGDDGGLTAPPALRGVLARALMAASAVVERMYGEPDDQY